MTIFVIVKIILYVNGFVLYGIDVKLNIPEENGSTPFTDLERKTPSKVFTWAAFSWKSDNLYFVFIRIYKFIAVFLLYMERREQLVQREPMGQQERQERPESQERQERQERPEPPEWQV